MLKIRLQQLLNAQQRLTKLYSQGLFKFDYYKERFITRRVSKKEKEEERAWLEEKQGCG